MAFIQRENGAVKGVYPVAQPGIAEEELPDDDAEVQSFRNPPAGLSDLAPYQFWAMLELSGKKDQLLAFIAGLPAQQRIIAQAKLDRSLQFERKNALVETARVAMGMTPGALDSLWMQAAEIS